VGKLGDLVVVTFPEGRHGGEPIRVLAFSAQLDEETERSGTYLMGVFLFTESGGLGVSYIVVVPSIDEIRLVSSEQLSSALLSGNLDDDSLFCGAFGLSTTPELTAAGEAGYVKTFAPMRCYCLLRLKGDGYTEREKLMLRLPELDDVGRSSALEDLEHSLVVANAAAVAAAAAGDETAAGDES
jgi:hypothetical protein